MLPYGSMYGIPHHLQCALRSYHVVIPSFLPLYEFCGGGFCLFPSIIDGSEIIFKIFLWVWNIFSECVKRLGTIERGDGRVEVGSLAVGYL